MFVALNRRLRDRDEGFTLIELMVVVLIIAILIAIAVPTFLGARRRAQDKAAQSNLRNGLTSEKTFYVDEQHYAVDVLASTDLTALQGIESSLQWDNPQASVGGVDVITPATQCAAGAAGCQTVVMRSDSASGTVFCLGDVATAADPLQAGTYYANSAATCATTPPGAGWSKDSSVGW